jgi:uncharacterized lipoprotein YddW (UPF0748 family)
MRAAWIATVTHIDWPSRYSTTAEQQQTMLDMLDTLAQLNMNAIIFQVRPTADTFYQSDIELWSHFLTGKQGTAPDPFYDPLAFTVEEAHRRNIEVHVWLNPYRVLNADRIELLDSTHLYYQHPHMFVKYGNQYYFNPALEATRIHLNRVVADIVTRYDVDAIHFDDYFYPYPEKDADFPDDDTFIAGSRGFTSKDDWRRDNVNLVIAQLQRTIKEIKPWVQFGISPFGVWRNSDKDPRGSATKAGATNYDALYADILKWLEDGDIDYVVPQLYWEIGKKVADYAILVEWWSRNAYNKNLYIGLFANKLGDTKADTAWTTGNELMRQMQLNTRYPQVQGEVFFSIKSLVNNNAGLADSLKNTFYRYPALMPENPAIVGEASAPPAGMRLVKNLRQTVLVWDSVVEEGGKSVASYVVYAFKGNAVGDLSNAANIVAITTGNQLNLKTLDRKLKGRYTFAVTTVNRYKKESVPVSVTGKI